MYPVEDDPDAPTPRTPTASALPIPWYRSALLYTLLVALAALKFVQSWFDLDNSLLHHGVYEWTGPWLPWWPR